MKIFFTNEVWSNLYASHQKFLEAAKKVGAKVDMVKGSPTISEGDYFKVVLHRLTTSRDATEREKLMSMIEQKFNEYRGLEAKLTELEAKPKAVKKWYHKATESLTDFITTWSIFATSNAAIFVTLAAALTLQIHHLAVVINRMAENDGILHGYSFAAVAELTALMLTVHARKKGILIVFAIVQFWVNVLYYAELPDIVTQITLSGLIAFVIYSYSEIYTNLKIDPNGKEG